jgi:xylan 1,4-beta-xylosidase
MKPHLGLSLATPPALATPACLSAPVVTAQPCGRGTEGQRRADLGDGSFRNPVLPGDHPEPSLLQDGADYYLSAASFRLCPGAVIWHSPDLVNWTPLGAALARPIGSVQAVHLVKHAGRYFIYLGVLDQQRSSVHVIHADDMRGPWSDPVDLGLHDCAGPAHVVGEDGQRYLFVNGLRYIQLCDDGLATTGVLTTVEAPAAEGARLLRRGDFFYLAAIPAGSTQHLVTAARSPSIHGPWEPCPFEPITRAAGAAAPWETGGPLGLAQGPAGDWWMVCHGYERGYRTLGRQTLLQPVEWTRDGWFRVNSAPLDRAQRKPRGAAAAPADVERSDDFTRNRLGLQWSFFDAAPGELQRARYDGDGLVLRGKGSGLSDCSPLICTAGDHSYQAELDLELTGAAQGGLALFHDARGFVGVGLGNGLMHTYNYGQEHRWTQQPVHGQRHRLRVTNRRHLITFEHAMADGPWTQNPWLRAVSALHQNAYGGFPGLRLALFAAGEGEVRLRRFSYRVVGHDT